MADVKKINGYDINDDISRTNIGCTQDTYDNSKTYAIDDVVVYDNKIYKCITAVTAAEDFNSTKWQQICLRDLLLESRVRVSPTKPTTNEKVWIDNINKKIYFKNDNGVFEEFVNAEEIKDTGWISLNSQIKYRKKNGTVFVKGLSNGAVTIGNAQYTVIGTLPSEYKPDESFYFVWTGMGGDINNQSAKIETNGEISLYLPSGKTTSYWAFFISFPI